MKKLACIVMVVMILMGCAFADDNAWAFCKTYVNIRMSPTKKSEQVGFLDCGDGFETDWVERHGWLHCLTPVDGWVYSGYVVDNKPEKVDSMYMVSSNWKVALRRTVGGERISWAKPEKLLKVYWKSDIWALTNHGYIMIEYLDEVVE